MLLLPRTRASRAQPKAPPREARAMAICPHTTRGAEGVKVGEVARRVMAGSKGGAGRAPEDRFGVQRWVESPKVCGWECARLVCACMCSISVSECVGLVVRKTALLFPLPVLPPLSGSSELRLCCPAPAFKYLTPSLCFPLSSHPPSLPSSLCLSFAPTPAPRVLYALYKTASLLSLIQLFSPPSSPPVYHSEFFLNLVLPLSYLLFFTSH